MSKPRLIAAEVRRDSGQFVVTVEDVEIDRASTRSDALSRLCRVAIERRETLIVTVRDGAGKKYMTVSPIGEIAPSTAPAPTSVRPEVRLSDDSIDLGVSDDGPEDTRSWVEATMLDYDQRAEATSKRRRGFLRRR